MNRPLVILILFSINVIYLSADEPQRPTLMEKVVVNEQTKTHTLFMGVDLAVHLGNVLYPVKSVTGSNWVIEVDGRDRLIPTKASTLDLNIAPTLKLTDVSAKIEGFLRMQTYSYDNDPNVLLTRSMTNSALQNADFQAMAANAQHLADAEYVNKAGGNSLGGMAAMAGADQEMGGGALQYSAHGVAIGSPASQKANQAVAVAGAQAHNAEEPVGQVASKGLDAMDVAFTISSPRPLREPYVVTLARFTSPGSKPGMTQTLVYAQAIDPVDPTPASIHFVEEGFPFNFELLDFQLHIYNRGEEVATNISQKRVELTRDEAFEYVKIEYLSKHRRETLAASLAMGRLPTDLPRQLSLGRYSSTFYVRVDKEGVAGEAYTDMLCLQRIVDPYLDSVLKGLRFKPALANGKPIEGVAPVNLNKLSF